MSAVRSYPSECIYQELCVMKSTSVPCMHCKEGQAIHPCCVSSCFVSRSQQQLICLCVPALHTMMAANGAGKTTSSAGNIVSVESSKQHTILKPRTMQAWMLLPSIAKHVRGLQRMLDVVSEPQTQLRSTSINQVLGTDMKKHFDITSRFQVIPCSACLSVLRRCCFVQNLH